MKSALLSILVAESQAGVFLDVEPAWLVAVLTLLVAGMGVAICRRVLDVSTRKKLFAQAPPERHAELENYLDHKEEYLSSLRSLDLMLRLGIVLALTLGRLRASQTVLLANSDTLLEGLRLAGELLALFVIFLELTPWVLARVRTESWILRLLRTMDRVHRISAPFRAVFQAVVRGGVTLLGGKLEEPSVDTLEEEILSVAEEGEREGLIDSRDIDMIGSIITFGEKQVSEILTPRTLMVALDANDDFQVNLKRAIECGHSRIPVIHNSKDNIVGILYVKDLLNYWNEGEEVDLLKIVRDPHYVGPQEKIDDLLQRFKSQRFHMAIVQDTHGGTAGLVTIEDILEEIVGDITDEHEPVELSPVRHLTPNMIDVDARLHVDDLNEQLGIELPEDDSYETIGGFVFSQMGRIPNIGEVYSFDSGVRMRVTAADDRQIRRVTIELPETRETPEPAADSQA